MALYARPDWLSGFQTGVSIYHDVFHPVGLPQVGEEIVTVHVVYTGSKLEWLNEGAVLRHAVDDPRVPDGWRQAAARALSRA